jgi:SAM-dependent methyltransferase
MASDASELDLPDASVDLIVSNLGFNNFENREAVLRTCFRVSKPGAPLLLTTNLVGHMAELYDLFRATLEETGRADLLPALQAHIDHRATVPSLVQFLQEGKFEVQDVFTESFRMRFADGTSLLRHHFVRRGFMRGWKAVVPPEALESVFAALERNLNALAGRRGELSLTVPMACIQARRPPV